MRSVCLGRWSIFGGQVRDGASRSWAQAPMLWVQLSRRRSVYLYEPPRFEDRRARETKISLVARPSETRAPHGALFRSAENLDDDGSLARPIVEVEQDELLPDAQSHPAADDRNRFRGADQRGALMGM